jgi:hypothetical protein
LQGTAPTEDNKKNREGFSEATALAAGLAALILACFAAIEAEQGIDFMKPGHMDQIFETLAKYKQKM